MNIDNDKKNPVGTKNKNKNTRKKIKFGSKKPFVFLLNAGTFLGLVFAYKFFAGIGYTPDFEVKDIASLLIGIALTGGLFVVLLSVYFVVPAHFLNELVWKPHFLYEKTDGEEKKQIDDKCEKKRSKAFVKTSVLFGICATAMMGSVAVFFGIQDADVRCYSVAIGLASIIIPVVVQRIRYKRAGPEAAALFGASPVLSNVAIAATWAVASMVLLFIVIYPLVDYISEEDYGGAVLLAAFLFFTMAANSGLATLRPQSGNKKSKYPILANQYVLIMICGAALAFLFLNMPNNKMSIVNGVFRGLGLGNLPNTTFIVSKTSCEAANLIRLNTCIALEHSEYGCIRPTLLLSRVGSEYYMSFSNKDAKAKDKKSGKEIRFPIKKSEVLMWSIESGAANSTACTATETDQARIGSDAEGALKNSPDQKR